MQNTLITIKYFNRDQKLIAKNPRCNLLLHDTLLFLTHTHTHTHTLTHIHSWSILKHIFHWFTQCFLIMASQSTKQV